MNLRLECYSQRISAPRLFKLGAGIASTYERPAEKLYLKTDPDGPPSAPCACCRTMRPPILFVPASCTLPLDVDRA